MNRIQEIKSLFVKYDVIVDYTEKELINDIRNIVLAKKHREFVDDKDKEKYLRLCEDVFALAEDFNREQYNEEALLLKDLFVNITKDLCDDDMEDLQTSINSRGL